jgi:aminoacyl tRNA synthase complex-interacting multifunctional protein 1
MFPFTKPQIKELATKKLKATTEIETSKIIEVIAEYRQAKVLLSTLETDLLGKTFALEEYFSVVDLFLLDSVFDQWKSIKLSDKISKWPNVTRYMNLMQRLVDGELTMHNIEKGDWTLVPVDLNVECVDQEKKVEKKVEKAEKKMEKAEKKMEKAEKKQEKVDTPKGPDPSRIDLRVGVIVKIARHENADSLYVEQIDLGEEQPRTVCSGLVKWLKEDQLLNKKVICVCNLKPAKMRGVESSAMVLCATSTDDTMLECIQPPPNAAPGSRVYIQGFEQPEPEVVLNPKKKQWETVQLGYKIVNGEAVWEHEGKLNKFVVVGIPNGVCTVVDKVKLEGASIR